MPVLVAIVVNELVVKASEGVVQARRGRLSCGAVRGTSNQDVGLANIVDAGREAEDGVIAVDSGAVI